MKKRTVALAAMLATASLAPLWSLAQPADVKGFVFASGAAPKLHAEPKEGAKGVGTPPIGTRLLYKKVVKSGDGIAWYFVDQPGVGTGWLAASDAVTARPVAPPALKPIARVTPYPPAAEPTGTIPQASTEVAATRSAQTSAGRTATKGKLTRGLSARTLDARALSASEANEIVERALIDYTTLERRVGFQMSDPPHTNGLYANLTARGRKADAEAFAKTVQEGD